MDQAAVNDLGVDQNIWIALRDCQKNAVRCGIGYLTSSLEQQENKACLLSLPTGAGKSGVIATLAHYAPQHKVLVLCHRRYVCNQLAKQIEGGFFHKTAPVAVTAQRTVFDSIDDISHNGIYVTTFQMLSRQPSEHLDEIREQFDLIIIDEGHSEPSPVWRTLVRGANSHRIIVTATPYRNDLFQFDVSPHISYIYTFAEAAEDGVLFAPRMESVESNDLEDAINSFLKANPELKCIVKCKNFDEVQSYFERLSKLAPTIAVHDAFENDSLDVQRVSVPKDIAESAYRILIHQHKLDEGVDIPCAKLLVLTYVVGSGRELVQTIGRVVRAFKNQEPVVLEIADDANRVMWESYLDFDASLKSEAGVAKFLSSLDSAKLIELYLDAFPDFSYHQSRFVGKFNINDFDPDEALVIPTASICFLNSHADFSIAKAADTLYWRATNCGELCKIFVSRSTSIQIVLSVAFNKSRFLAKELFFEPSLEITLLREMKNGVVAIFDSRGRSFSGDSELDLAFPLPQEKLLKVMTRDGKMRPKETSTRAIGKPTRRPEAMHLKGANLDEIGGQQQFSAYRMSTLKCDTLNDQGKKSGSFYVGIDSGRISDHKDRKFRLSDLAEWFDMIEDCLASSNEATSRVLSSFAKPIIPTGPLELEALMFEFMDPEEAIRIEAGQVAVEVSDEFLFYECADQFQILPGIASTTVKVSVSHEEPYIEFSACTSLVATTSDGVAMDIEELLSARLSKALFKNGITYSGGRFYELRLPTQGGIEIEKSELSNVIVGLPALLHEGLSEKGTDKGPNDDEFDPDSVFYLIDQLKSFSNANPSFLELGPFYDYVSHPDILLCADMGTEPADFIISSREKLVYVHVKCGKSSQKPQSAAGAIAEVGSQAVKNLEMLMSGDRNLRAGNWTELLNDWPTNTADKRLESRIRLLDGKRFDGSSANLQVEMERLWSIIADRRKNIAVKKEIWIVAANSFSRSDFASQMGLGAHGRSESLQAYQLIQGWIGACSNLDVEIRLFVAP